MVNPSRSRRAQRQGRQQAEDFDEEEAEAPDEKDEYGGEHDFEPADNHRSPLKGGLEFG